MAFDPFQTGLPVTEIIAEVRTRLASENTLIIHAPPGAGKSTLLPLALLEEPWLKDQKMILLEPRRLAARGIATRMAELLGEQVGQTVGYRIRFETRVSAQTRIEVVTEGILTRMLHSDNSLEGTGLVLFDEFHERSIHSDVALALCREAQQILRPDLRLVVMSATLDVDQLRTVLKTSVASSEGRMYPVDIRYMGQQDDTMIAELTARAVTQAAREQQGDILVFLPGEGEIRKCEELLRGPLASFALHPLYGQLPFQQQYQALRPNPHGKRKVVLATSIAETSLTIEGIKVVVDSGFGRTMRFDPKSGLSRLETVRISKDVADQRAGRAGRLSAGVCYRMWSLATHERLADHRTPEILEADLAPLVLDLAQWGVVNPQQLAWLTPPPAGNVAMAIDTLEQLGALENGKITSHGKAIHRLPCHPRIAHMLLEAEQDELLALGCDLAAVLEERDPLGKEAGIDINSRIEGLRTFRERKSDPRKWSRMIKVAESYRQLFDVAEDNGAFDPYATGLLLAQVYPERIACARPGNNAQFQLANGRLAMASHRDDLAHEPWLAVAHLDAREGMGKIFLASPLNPKDLRPMVKEVDILTWDTKRGGIIATRDLRIGSIVLQSRPLPNPGSEHLAAAISQAVRKEGERLLPFSDEVTNWQNRVLSLRKWNPGQNWPDVSTPTLVLTNAEWLMPYLSGVKTPEDLKKLNLAEILHSSLPYEQQQALQRLAPESIAVPSGSQVALQYGPDGAPPVLAVRLQEVFGLEDTPRINDGKNGIVLHLLSPGYKPVQITSDLRSFWNNTYYEVKKELKRRYPKHSWPDDPWTAEAVRGVRRKNPLF